MSDTKTTREDDTESRRVDKELKSYLSILPPEVDKLKEASELVIAESRKLRIEARKTRDSAPRLQRPILKK